MEGNRGSALNLQGGENVTGTSDISNRILDAEEVELAERTRSVYPEPLYDAPGVELVAAGKRAELGAIFIPTKADAAILL